MVQYLLHSLPFDNLHAAQFLAAAAIPTQRLTATDAQCAAVIKAAQDAGMDEHHTAFLAEAMLRDPLTFGIVRPAPVPMGQIKPEEHPHGLPEHNSRYVIQRLTNPSRQAGEGRPYNHGHHTAHKMGSAKEE